MRACVSWWLIICLILCVTGCAEVGESTLTGKMWSSTSGVNHYVPANPPNLQLSETLDRKDLLVQYDEEYDKTGVITHRAYLLNANQNRLDAGKKPKFVDARTIKTGDAVSVTTNSLEEVVTARAEPMLAVLMPDGRSFTLVSGGHELEIFHLPVYADSGGFYERVGLTPLTVLGDVLIAAAMLGVIVGVAYLAALATSQATWELHN